jgi:O-antigen/teichoic acid export membrane protein
MTVLEQAIPTSPAASQPQYTGRARRGLFAASHLAGQAILLNAISVPVMAYIIRSLGAERYGQWSTAAVLVSVASVLTNLGLRGTFVRSVARDPDSARPALAEQLGIRTLLSLAAALTVLAVAVVLKYPPAVLWCTAVGALGILLGALTTTLCDLLQGLHRMSVYAAANFVGGLCLTALSVVVIWFGGGPVALAAAYLAGPAVSAVMLLAFIKRKLFPVTASWSPRQGWKHLKHSRFFAAQQFVNILITNQESLLLPKIVGSGVFGLFSAGLLLASRLVIIPDALGSTFYPIIAESHARDPRAASRESVRFLLLSLIVCLPIVVVVLFFSGPLAHVLFQKNWEVCRKVICITIWSLPLMGLESVMGYALNAAGRDARQARFTFYSATVSLLLAVILVINFGLIGACWSYLLRSVIKIAFIAPLFAKTFSPTLPVGRLARILACSAAMAAGMWFVRNLEPAWSFTPTHPVGLRGWSALLGSWSIQGTLGLVAYAAALLGLRILRPSDLALLLRRHHREVLA